jgi:hypothetical protein
VGAEGGEGSSVPLPVDVQSEPGPGSGVVGAADAPDRASIEEDRVPATANLVGARPGHNATISIYEDDPPYPAPDGMWWDVVRGRWELQGGRP